MGSLNALLTVEIGWLAEGGVLRGEACRGAGEVLGRKQSGQKAIGCLRACSLPEDQDLLEAARGGAVSLLEEHGLEPDQWPPCLLAALGDRELPTLDISQIPANSLAAHDASLKDFASD